MFTKFQSLVNENPKVLVPILNSEKAEESYIVTEKLHGANFSVYLIGLGNLNGNVRFASRSNFLPEDTNFMNCTRYFTKEKIADLKDLASHLKEGYSIRVIGEIFGGHDAIGIKPVQRNIKYKGDIQFRAFAVEVIHDNGKIDYLDWESSLVVFDSLSLECVPILAYGTLKEVYPFDVEVKSTLTDDDTQIMEGICIRQIKHDVDTQPLILKKRSKDYLETKGIKNLRKDLTLDPRFLDILADLESMVTGQRVSNVNSHHGYNKMADFKDLHFAVVQDIAKDAESDLGVDIMSKDFKEVRKILCSSIVPFVKKELLGE